MGREIVRALGGERAGVLERWMAHHIAELMERAENAPSGPEREEAEKACRAAILEAWGRRSSWPYGGPLERVAPLLSLLAGRPDSYFSEPDRPDPPEGWFSLWEDLHDLDLDERQIVVDVEAARMDLDAERRALAEGGDQMEAKERELLQWFIKRADTTEAEDYRLGPVEAPAFRDLEPSAQHELIERAFGEVARRRAAAVVRAVADLE